MQWTTIKPDFKEECTLVTANRNGTFWEYKVWQIEEVNVGEGPYMAWLTGEGEECGDLPDLKADKYLILPAIT